MARRSVSLTRISRFSRFSHSSGCSALLLALLFLPLQAAFAGDIAEFINYGFTPDGAVYLYGEYGVDEDTLRPWANLGIVDTARNEFLNGGRLSYRGSRKVRAGQDGREALDAVIAENAALTAAYGIGRPGFLVPGTPLYIASPDAPRLDTVNFRDFERETSYRAALTAARGTDASGLWSSFYISLERTGPDGFTTSRIVGSPSVRRPGVSAYTIRQVS